MENRPETNNGSLQINSKSLTTPNSTPPTIDQQNINMSLPNQNCQNRIPINQNNMLNPLSPSKRFSKIFKSLIGSTGSYNFIKSWCPRRWYGTKSYNRTTSANRSAKISIKLECLSNCNFIDSENDGPEQSNNFADNNEKHTILGSSSKYLCGNIWKKVDTAKKDNAVQLSACVKLVNLNLSNQLPLAY